MSQAPRRINTDRSLNRPDQAAKAAPRPTAGTTGTSGRPAAGSTSGSGRSAPPRHSAQPARQVEPPRRRKKKKKTPLWLPFAVGELRGDLVVDELVTSKYGENWEVSDY